MPRKMRKSKGRRGGGGTSRVETVRGRVHFEYAIPWPLGSSLNNSAVSEFITPLLPGTLPTGGQITIFGNTKLAAMSKLFTLFRFSKLRCRILPGVAVGASAEDTAGFSAVVGFQPTAPGATPVVVATYDQVMEMPWQSESVALQPDGGTVPSVPRWYSVPKRMLLGQPLNWWQNASVSNPQGINIGFLVQGILAVGLVGFAPTVNGQFVSFGLDLQYDVQFKDFALAADSIPQLLTIEEFQKAMDRVRKSGGVTTFEQDGVGVDEKGQPLAVRSPITGVNSLDPPKRSRGGPSHLDPLSLALKLTPELSLGEIFDVGTDQSDERSDDYHTV